MKQLLAFLISFTLVFSLRSQTISVDVTITVAGDKDLKVSVDGSNYSLTNSRIVGNKTIFNINDLQNGQHTLLISRTDQNTNRPVQLSTIFNLRNNYDMRINVNSNGSFELIEIKKAGISDGQPPINTYSFNTLLKSVRSQRSNNTRAAMITNAFNKPNNFFTTNQARQLIQLVNAERDRLRLAKLSYKVITNQSDFYELYDLLNSQNSRNELEDFVKNYYDENYGNIAMSDVNFNNLYQRIQQEWPVSTQMNSLTSAFNNTANYFTSYQASRLIQLVTAESNRLQLAKLAYRSITDRSNFNQVFNLLSYQSSKDELTAYINNYNAGRNSTDPMSDANFNNLYQRIQQEWPVSTQMNSLTSAFNNTANYFTSYQASRLIQLVTAESNRLQLAKLAYRSITDRSNFNQVYNLLNYQSSKDELIAYINNYTAGGNTRVPMSEADFNSLYQATQMQFFPGERMNALVDVFNKTTNFFTCAQAKQLIQLITMETNRLQLAKLSYRALTDRSNISLLYELLESQANKDALEAYINAYKE